ncbi:hypothetical protein BGZ70_007152 [Mortierella alpina]|uniref:Uncharacterized protein n=1 Tax=Mortierella alpina TaxID=64518 RepID=A0A9P6J8Y6_MORAP|nr:hypothetical protein BGZ70_007152 [Mortierella alpina]
MSRPTTTAEVKRLSNEIAELLKKINTETDMIKTYDSSLLKTKASYLVPGQVPTTGLLEREKIRTQMRENSLAMKVGIQKTLAQNLQKWGVLKQKLDALRKAP